MDWSTTNPDLSANKVRAPVDDILAILTPQRYILLHLLKCTYLKQTKLGFLAAANNEAEPASPPQLMPHLPTTTTNVHEIGLQSQVNVPVSVYNKANMFVPIIANSSYPCCFTLIMIEVQVLETNHGWSSAGIGTSSNQVGYLITPVIYPLTGTYNKRNKFED